MRTKVNLSLDADVVAEARALGVNMSRAAQEAVERANRAARNRRWREENREALEAYAREVEREGLALDDLRLF